MKKYLNYIVICFLMFFCFNSNVNAEYARICTYHSKSLTTDYYDVIYVTKSGITGYRTTERNFLPDIHDQSTQLTLNFTKEQFMKNWDEPSAKCPSKVYGDVFEADVGILQFGQNIYLEGGFLRSDQDKIEDKYTDLDNYVPNPGDEEVTVDPPGGGESIFTGSCPSNSGIVSIIKALYRILKIAAPIALVIYGMLDFAKAVIASDEGQMKKAQSAFVRRLLAAIVVILVTSLVSLLSSLIPSESGVFSCVENILK